MPSRRCGRAFLIPEEPEGATSHPLDGRRLLSTIIDNENNNSDSNKSSCSTPSNDNDQEPQSRPTFSPDSTSSVRSSKDGAASFSERRASSSGIFKPASDALFSEQLLSPEERSPRGILKVSSRGSSKEQATTSDRRLSMASLTSLQVPSTPESEDDSSSAFHTSFSSFFARRNSLHDRERFMMSSSYNNFRERELSFSLYGYHHGREREFGSSSHDSHTLRRRIRRNSSSRLSTDIEDDANEVTLLSFAHSAQALYCRLHYNLQKVLRRVFFKPKFHSTKVVCEAEIMEQATWICKDYVLNHLAMRDLLSRRVGLVAPHWAGSDHVIMAGQVLENSYPRIYSNLCRKLSVTLCSAKVVRTYLNSFLGVLFEGGRITWAKIVSMFAVAGLFAEECSSQGHPEFVHIVVDTVVDFTATMLLQWLVGQGGWEYFPTSELHDSARISKFGLLLIAGGVSLIVVTTSLPLAAILD